MKVHVYVTEHWMKVSPDGEEDLASLKTKDICHVQVGSTDEAVAWMRKEWPGRPLIVIDGGMVLCPFGVCVQAGGAHRPAGDSAYEDAANGKLQLWNVEAHCKVTVEEQADNRVLKAAVEATKGEDE